MWCNSIGGVHPGGTLENRDSPLRRPCRGGFHFAGVPGVALADSLHPRLVSTVPPGRQISRTTFDYTHGGAHSCSRLAFKGPFPIFAGTRPNPEMKVWLVIFPLLFTQPIARAALKWEQLRADLAPGPKDKSVEAKFPFVNEGQTTVTIEAVKSSCGCTTAALDKMVYAPGEKGELRARFDIGQRRGLQSKTISVKIQNEPTATILTLAVAIAEPMKLKPALVVWEKGEANKAKSMTLAALPGQPIRAVKVTSTDPRMRATVETIKEGESYAISVAPESTDAAGFATLTIDAELAGATQTLRAYAQIKPAAQ